MDLIGISSRSRDLITMLPPTKRVSPVSSPSASITQDPPVASTLLKANPTVTAREQPTVTPPEGIPNMRDVADADPARLRRGRLWRSSMLYTPAALAARGVELVIDLRSELESWTACPGAPRVRVDVVRRAKSRIWAMLPVRAQLRLAAALLLGKRAGVDPKEIMMRHIFKDATTIASFYIAIIDSAHAEIAEAMRLLAGARYPALIHCTHGKDRTGICAALALRLCGVGVEAVLSDYARSEQALKGVPDPSASRPGALLAPGTSASTPRAAMAAALAHIDAAYGGVESYLSRIGLSSGEMAAIRRNLLVDPDGA